jgi:hypothetical protein
LDWLLTVEKAQEGQELTETAEGEAAPAEAANDKDDGSDAAKARAARSLKQRGPPEDGIPSKTKVMVANLPYDLTEDKVGYTSSPLDFTFKVTLTNWIVQFSSRRSSPLTSPSPPRLLCALSPAS